MALSRSRLWEVQTPQVAQCDLLERGFAKVRAEGLAVTDEEALADAAKDAQNELRAACAYHDGKSFVEDLRNVSRALIAERQVEEQRADAAGPRGTGGGTRSDKPAAGAAPAT